MRKGLVAVLVLSMLACTGASPAERGPRPGPGRPGGPGAERPGGPPGQGRMPPMMGRAEVTELNFTSGGKARSVYVHLPPASAGDGPFPVIVTMHGGATEGTEKGRMMAAVWDDHFDEPYVFVFPNSIYESVRPWFGPEDGDDSMRDIQFVHDAIDEVAKQVQIDRSRLYLNGFSAGAGFSWYASCVDADYWAGFATMSCTFPDSLVPRCEPKRQKPVFYIHGTKDRVISYEGDDIARRGAEGTFEVVLQSRKCTQKPKDTKKVEGENGIVAHGSVHACELVPEVELWRAEGQDHCVAIEGGRCGGYETSDLVLAYWKRTAGL